VPKSTHYDRQEFANCLSIPRETWTISPLKHHERLSCAYLSCAIMLILNAGQVFARVGGSLDESHSADMQMKSSTLAKPDRATDLGRGGKSRRRTNGDRELSHHGWWGGGHKWNKWNKWNKKNKRYHGWK
jgi:hypothetical protein